MNTPEMPGCADPCPACPPYDAEGRAAAESVVERAIESELLQHELARLLGEMVQALDVEHRLRGRLDDWQPPHRRALLIAAQRGPAAVLALVKDWLSVKPTRAQLEQALRGVLAGEREGLAREAATWCPTPPLGCGEGGGGHAPECPRRQRADVGAGGSR